MKRLGWLAVGALFAARAGAAHMFTGEIAMTLLERALNRAGPPPLDDGLHAAFCGTGSPLQDRARAGPCLAVIAGTRLLVFDAGEGAAETLSLMGFAPAGFNEA